MAKFIYILILLLSMTAIRLQAEEFDRLTFVKTDSSTVSFSVEGLKITYDDFAHAVITNDETSMTLDLASLKCMYFSNGGDSAFATGDVNGDGEVNVADVNTLVDIILGGGADDATIKRADVNEDGEITLADVNALTDIIHR